MTQKTYFKDKSVDLPYDGSQNNRKTSQIRTVCIQLSFNLKYINNGGCGIFAVMLDSIFNGGVAQLRFLRNIDPYDIYGFDTNIHEFFLKDSLCYDAYATCRLDTLFRKKRIKRIISMEALVYHQKPHQCFLIKRDCQSILNDYIDGHYNPRFANRYQMGILFNNYEKVIEHLPQNMKSQVNFSMVNKILDYSKPIIYSLVA